MRERIGISQLLDRERVVDAVEVRRELLEAPALVAQVGPAVVVGAVRLRSADPLAKPEIDPGYLSDPAGNDLRVLAAGLELARRIVSMPALTQLAGDEIAPGGAPLQAHTRDTAHGIYHPVGTCRMGADELAVVDHQLRVRGLDGLRVVDASIIPRIPRGHTNLPTMVIADKAADLICDATAASQQETAGTEVPLVTTQPANRRRLD